MNFQPLAEKIGASRLLAARPLNLQGFHRFYILSTDIGDIFVKEGPQEALKGYEAEFKGLQAIENTKTVHVPHPYGYETLNHKAYLALEYIELRPRSFSADAMLGKQLAAMHLTAASKQYGFILDNTLGPTTQINPWTDQWVQFLRSSRLEYQLKLIYERYGDEEVCLSGRRLCDHLEVFFTGISVQPSLLHGDLWSGNAAAAPNGEPVIYDPACYYGHHEAELSIMHMFGGFSKELFEAYHALIPKEEGFEERFLCYQLYHYLNHYNIFGTRYRTQCLRILLLLLQRIA